MTMFESCITTQSGPVCALAFNPERHQCMDFPAALRGLEGERSLLAAQARCWLENRSDSVPILISWIEAVQTLEKARAPFEATGTPEEQFEALLERVKALHEAVGNLRRVDDRAAGFFGRMDPLCR